MASFFVAHAACTHTQADIEELYSFGKELGVGNFARVRKARHLKTNKICAAKIIDKSLCTTKLYAARCLQPARAAALTIATCHPRSLSPAQLINHQFVFAEPIHRHKVIISCILS